MRIRSLTLKNFRCFPDLQVPVEFDNSMTVLAATNGRGKSSILDAITVALSPYTAQFEHGGQKGFKLTDAYLKAVQPRVNSRSNLLSTEIQFPVVLEAGFEIENQIVHTARRLTGPKGRTTIKEAAALKEHAVALSNRITKEETAVNTILPVISYYGTGRLHAQKRLTQKGKTPEAHNPQSRTMGYLNCLSAESTYKHFAEWMKETTLSQLQESDPSYFEGNPEIFEGMLQGVRMAVQCVLQDQAWSDLRYTVKSDQLTVLESNARISLASLSDGLRSIIAMVGDLAYRCIALNPQLGPEAPKVTPGIVLIDELEMHLHPAWQQKVLAQLQHAFPFVQFVCTTHSPQILSTVRPRSIRTLHEGGKVMSPTCKTYGAESKRVMEELMRVDSRPPVLVNELREFITLTDGGDWFSQRYRELRELLLNELGPSDPVLINAEIKKNFQQLEVE